MKLIITTLALTITLATTSVMAEEQVLVANSVVENSVSDTAILSQVFETNQLDNVQAIELSNQEMKDTQGAVAPLVYYGMVYGPSAAAFLYRWGSGPGPQILYHKIAYAVQ